MGIRAEDAEAERVQDSVDINRMCPEHHLPSRKEYVQYVAVVTHFALDLWRVFPAPWRSDVKGGSMSGVWSL
jgi:hypothetical protein